MSSSLDWVYENSIHLTAATIREDLGAAAFEEALKFSIVRHPVDRYVSACRQCEVDANSPEVWDKVRRGIHPHWGGERPYHIFVTQVDSTFVDGQQSCKIFRFEEDLPHNLHTWLKNQGLACREFPFRKPCDGITAPKQELTPEALAFVQDFYSIDFEVFGYAS